MIDLEADATVATSTVRSVLVDPLTWIPRLATRINTLWLRKTYPFAAFGASVSIHYTCELSRPGSRYVDIGDDVYLARDVWLNLVQESAVDASKIVLKRGCKIGRRSTISARNHIELGEDVLLAPAVLIMDHNHQYSDPTVPIHAQGVTNGGRITIEENCWIGYGAVICCARGELLVGRNSVIAANSVVTKNVPSYSVVGGNPARILKQYDLSARAWVTARQPVPV